MILRWVLSLAGNFVEAMDCKSLVIMMPLLASLVQRDHRDLQVPPPLLDLQVHKDPKVRKAILELPALQVRKVKKAMLAPLVRPVHEVQQVLPVLKDLKVRKGILEPPVRPDLEA